MTLVQGAADENSMPHAQKIIMSYEIRILLVI